MLSMKIILSPDSSNNAAVRCVRALLIHAMATSTATLLSSVIRHHTQCRTICDAHTNY